MNQWDHVIKLLYFFIKHMNSEALRGYVLGGSVFCFSASI